MRVADVLAVLEKSYPLSTACDFDNCGLLVGDGDAEVTGIVVTLDGDEAALNAAVENGCNLIVTHHPVIFSGLKTLTADSLCYRLLKSGISVVSMHTNLDVGAGGVNDQLCRAVGLSDVEPYVAADGFTLRRGTCAPSTAEEFAAHLKTVLGGNIRFVDGGKTLRRVLVCSGSGSEFLHDVSAADCDALLTAEVKHHLFLEAAQMGVSLFEGGHFETENVVVDSLCEKLQRLLPALPVLAHKQTIIQSL